MPEIVIKPRNRFSKHGEQIVRTGISPSVLNEPFF